MQNQFLTAAGSDASRGIIFLVMANVKRMIAIRNNNEAFFPTMIPGS